MAALGPAVITPTKKSVIASNPKKRLISATIAFGDGASTYTSPGISLGASLLAMAQAFGMTRQIDSIDIIDPDAHRGYSPSIDLTNFTVRLFVEQAVGVNTPLVEVSNAFVPAATSMTVQAVGW